MNYLVRFFVERPLMANILLFGFIVFALDATRRIQREGFPEVAFNTVTIQTIYPGASAIDVETNVTVRIEEALEGVSGLSEVSSVSRENLSTITAKADDNASIDEFDRIFADIKQAIDAIEDLPTELDGRPVLRQVRSQDMPVVEIGISGSYKDLRWYVPKLEKAIRNISDVAQIHRLGLPDEEVRILIDPALARKYQVDLRSISHAIQTRNIEGTAGSIESYANEKKILIYNKISQDDQILDTILRMSPSGNGVYLRQIATIEKRPQETKLIVRTNGEPGVSLQIVKKSHSDIIRTIDKVTSIIDQIERPDGVKIVLLNDKSAFTRNRIGLLSSNAFMGFCLVVLLLCLIFGLRTAFWTAFGIPFSLLGAMVMLPAFNATFNALSIGGFVLVLGMLVDDAIVVAEQINKLREEGKSLTDAAVLGVVGIWKPVLASAITTIIAFSPLTQMGGTAGKFIWIIPTIVMMALMFSLIESYFFLPLHLSHGTMTKPRKLKFVNRLEQFYEQLLRAGLRVRYLLLASFLALFGAALFTAAKILPKDPFPQDGAEAFTIEVDLPAGSSLDKTQDTVTKVEAIIAQIPDDEMIGFTTRIGSQNKTQKIDRGTLENRALILVYLTPYAQRNRSASEILSNLRSKVEPVLAATSSYRAELIRLGPPIGKAFEVEISGNIDDLRLGKLAEIKSWLGKQPGVMDLGDDIIVGKREVRVQVKEDLLAQTGLTVRDIMSTFRIALDGLVVTQTVAIEGSTDYRLRLAGDSRKSVDELRKLQIRNGKGRLINLGSLVNFIEVDGIGEIQHLNGERTNKVYGNLDKSVMTAEQMAKKIENTFSSTENITVKMAGESKDNEEIFGSLLIAAILALLGTYLVIAVILNSLTKPLVVMSVVPFSMVGIVGTLLAHGLSISMFSMISLIGLTGIIVNASILMLYTIDGIKHENFHEGIIVGAVSRLRPILLTTLTTFLGLIPTAYGLGGYDPFISPMCLTMAFGLLFGTIILLFLVPSLYMFRQDLGVLWRQARKKMAFIGIFLVFGLAHSPQAEAQKFKLGDAPKLLQEHLMLKRANEVVRERGYLIDKLKGRFDSRLELKPTISYQETEPDFSSGFGGEQKTSTKNLDFSASKMIENGMLINASAGVRELELELGEKLGASESGTIPNKITRNTMTFGLSLSIPLWNNVGNELYHGQKQLARVGVELAKLQGDLTLDQLQLMAIQVYWQAWFQFKQWESSKRSLKRAKEIHRSNLKKSRLGLISKSERIISELHVIDKEDALAKNQRQWHQSLIALGKVFHKSAYSHIELLQGQWTFDSSVFSKKFVQQHNKQMALLDTREKSVSQQLSLVTMQAKDPVNLLASIQTLGSEDKWSEATSKSASIDKPTYMLGVSWSFQPRKSTSDSELRVVAAQRAQIALERQNLLVNLSSKGEETRSKIDMYKHQLKNLVVIEKKRRELVAQQRKEFEQGTITTKEFLESQDLLDLTVVQKAALVITKNQVFSTWLEEIGQISYYFNVIH